MSAPSHICVFIFKIDSGVGFGTWALAQEVATQDVPVWNYVFRAAPTDLAEWGAMHLTELAFVFSQPSWFPVETSESTVRALNWTQVYKIYFVDFSDWILCFMYV